MPISRNAVVAFLVIGLTAAVACSDTLTSPPGPEASKVIPSCQLGCLDQDPHPDSAGVFLGSGITPDMCTDGTDSDQDGLEDFCETNLALAFAPELRYWSGDETGREPHWAARPMAGDTVQIAYLISYYRDAGSLWGVCTLPWPLHDSSCDGHNGDSEAIYLDVYFRAATRHWLLNKAEYSAHNWPGVILRGTAAYPTGLEYPTHPGAYPRAWVSEGKHANYATQGGCNGGGNFDIDRCYDNDTSARLPAGAYLNIGSSTNHTATQDCMPSQDPLYQYYGSGRLECYWTNVQFRGWIPSWIGGAASDPYAPKLSAHGF